MALKSGGTEFLSDARNYTASANTALPNDAYILIANNDTVSSDGYSVVGDKAIDEDGFSFNQFNAEAQVVSFRPRYTQAQGTVSGYTSGGFSSTNIIDKFPFASDANATDVGDLTVARAKLGGASSLVSGYSMGGISPPHRNQIDKFPFAADGNATDVGDLVQKRTGLIGNESTVSGYSNGGSYIITNAIEKFPFASDGNSTDVGDTLASTGKYGASQSSAYHGYATGHSVPVVNTIERFPFSSDTNASDVGDLTVASFTAMGSNSYTHGYHMKNTQVDKFPFASNTNATDVGALSLGTKAYGAGQSSSLSGYSSGGAGAAGSVIDKFPFASEGTATDVGDLSATRYGATGQQV